MKKILFLTTVCMIFSCCAFAEAETKIFHAEAKYLMADSEPIPDAREKAFQKALREIAEQLGVYIESNSRTELGVLKKDEIVAISATVINVRLKEYKTDLTENGQIEISVFIDADADIEKAEKFLADAVSARKSSQNQEEGH